MCSCDLLLHKSYIAIHYLHLVVNVSAQNDGVCIVTPLSPNTLNASGGAIVSGTTNVRILCNCTDGGGVVLNSRWYDPDGTRLFSDVNDAFDATVPHFEFVTGVPRNIILVIPTFTASEAGTYTCGRNFASLDDINLPPTATTDLTICKLIISKSVTCVY